MRLNDKFSTCCFLNVFHMPLALGSGGWALRSPESQMYGSLPCSHSPQPVTHAAVHQSPSSSGSGPSSTLPSHPSPIHPFPILTVSESLNQGSRDMKMLPDCRYHPPQVACMLLLHPSLSSNIFEREQRRMLS